MPAAWPTASTPTGKLWLQAGAVDFDEQIYRAIEILLRDPEARSVAQSRCRHLLVDEFQDLNPAHMLLIRLLSAPAYDIFGVGDDDQVIYGYAGATPEYLINFEDYFAGAQAYALEVNYRCPPAVVTAATHVLSYNAARIAKTITTPAGSTDDLPDFGDPLRAHGPVAVIETEAELLPQTAVAAVAAWRDGGCHARRDRRALEGELHLAPGPGRPLRGGHPEQRAARRRRAATHGHRDHPRLPAHGAVTRCDPAGGHRPDDPPALAGDRAQCHQNAVGTGR